MIHTQLNMFGLDSNELATGPIGCSKEDWLLKERQWYQSSLAVL